jgi:energy-coupling factor transport system ATP-binding protein
VKPALAVEGASLRYPLAEAPSLSGLDLEVYPGELLVLAGRSGGGKSTFMRMVNGLAYRHYRAESSGSVKVLGAELKDKSLYEISQRVSSVFQNPEDQFFALTPRDEMLLSWECRGVPESEAGEMLERWSVALGLKGVLDRPLNLLSSGEKQKTVLASQLALSPSVLLLDEPSSNLDPASRRSLAESLAALKREGLAVVVADHRLRWLCGAADRALVLDGGKAVWLGPFDGLADPGLVGRWGLRRAGPITGCGTPPGPAALRDGPGRPRWPALTASPPAPASASAPTATGSGAPLTAGARQVPAGPPPGSAGLPTVPGGLAPGPAGFPPGVEFRELGFGFPGAAPLFEGLSAELPVGVPALVSGPNGRGKTTLMRLASGLLSPRAGEIRFGGEPLNARGRLARSSLVFQIADRQLCMGTVQDEIREAWKAWPRGSARGAEHGKPGRPGRPSEAEVEGVLEYWGLAGLALRHPQSLSGGEKQRLALAAAMARPSELLCLDEPSTGLDGANLALAAGAVTAAAGGRSVMLITHDEDLGELVPSFPLDLGGEEG